jgi:putative component of membrane protein insertase Oxa1/YidC/SpoIIIJ protein YidD
MNKKIIFVIILLFIFTIVKAKAKEESFSNLIIVCKSIIKFYRGYISPILASSCNFIPSCSKFSYKAIEEYKFWGILMSADRLLRCHYCTRLQGVYKKGKILLYDPVEDNYIFNYISSDISH